MKYIVKYKIYNSYEEQPELFVFEIMEEDELCRFADQYIFVAKEIDYFRDRRGIAKNKPLVKSNNRNFYRDIEFYAVSDIKEINIEDFVSKELMEKVEEYETLKKQKDEEKQKEIEIFNRKREFEEYNRLKKKFEEK